MREREREMTSCTDWFEFLERKSLWIDGQTVGGKASGQGAHKARMLGGLDPF